MQSKKEKNGFTLVELLAVIVILAVVMVIAVTAVGPLMTKSRKGALGSEGLGIVESAKTAYQAEQMSTGSNQIKATDSVCFDMQWLIQEGYFEAKKSLTGYSGSVLVKYDAGSYTYTFWISDGNYAFKDTNVDDYSYEEATDDKTADNTCGGQNSGDVKYKTTGA